MRLSLGVTKSYIWALGSTQIISYFTKTELSFKLIRQGIELRRYMIRPPNHFRVSYTGHLAVHINLLLFNCWAYVTAPGGSCRVAA